MVDRGDFSQDMYYAYQDRAHGIGYGQTISAPHMHCICLEELEECVSKEGSKVLDVGSGSGYLVWIDCRLTERLRAWEGWLI